MSTNANSNKKRRREDPTVSKLRYGWQILMSKMIVVSSLCKTSSTSPEIKPRAQEFVENYSELKKIVGKMESVVRGKEEEMRGLILDKGSSGVVGKKRRRKKVEVVHADQKTLDIGAVKVNLQEVVIIDWWDMKNQDV